MKNPSKVSPQLLILMQSLPSMNTSAICPLLIAAAALALVGCDAPKEDSADKQAARGKWKKHVVQEDIAPGEEGQPTMINTVVAEDFDKDGHIDLLASLQGKVMLYKGPTWERKTVMEEMPKDRTGRIAERGCIHSCLMDVDGDGDMDYIGSNRMLFWLECPEKPFEQEWKRRMIHLEVNGAHCVITADVDRDGKIDLIANSWRDESETTLPNSIAWFRTPENPKEDKLWTAHLLADRDAPGRNHYHGFADMNGDGRGDVCSGAPVGEWFAWWEQPEDPTQPWSKHVLSTDDPGATNILPADLNGDGKLDFVASRGHGKGVLWYPAPDYKKVEIDTELADPHCLQVADLDQDGDLDLATASCVADGHVVWYENDGSGKFTRHDLEAKQESYDLRIVDMDKDGDLDLLHAGNDSGNIVWYENPLK